MKKNQKLLWYGMVIPAIVILVILAMGFWHYLHAAYRFFFG